MSVRGIHEKQIAIVVQHMTTDISPLFHDVSVSASAGLSKNGIARLIAIANQEAHDARYAHLKKNDPYAHQRVNVEFWRKFNFPFPSSYEQISHLQCLKYLHDIIYHCDQSPNWECSLASKIVAEWNESLLKEIFKGISHLAPSRSCTNYAFYQGEWLKKLTDTIKASPEYMKLDHSM